MAQYHGGVVVETAVLDQAEGGCCRIYIILTGRVLLRIAHREEAQQRIGCRQRLCLLRKVFLHIGKGETVVEEVVDQHLLELGFPVGEEIGKALCGGCPRRFIGQRLFGCGGIGRKADAVFPQLARQRTGIG